MGFIAGPTLSFRASLFFSRTSARRSLSKPLIPTVRNTTCRHLVFRQTCIDDLCIPWRNLNASAQDTSPGRQSKFADALSTVWHTYQGSKKGSPTRVAQAQKLSLYLRRDVSSVRRESHDRDPMSQPPVGAASGFRPGFTRI